ncbi:hypothetical protein ACM66B_002394 [Microbotryomycetes sp. NB124-2]
MPLGRLGSMWSTLTPLRSLDWFAFTATAGLETPRATRHATTTDVMTATPQERTTTEDSVDLQARNSLCAEDDGSHTHAGDLFDSVQEFAASNNTSLGRTSPLKTMPGAWDTPKQTRVFSPWTTATPVQPTFPDHLFTVGNDRLPVPVAGSMTTTTGWLSTPKRHTPAHYQRTLAQDQPDTRVSLVEDLADNEMQEVPSFKTTPPPQLFDDELQMDKHDDEEPEQQGSELPSSADHYCTPPQHRMLFASFLHRACSLSSSPVRSDSHENTSDRHDNTSTDGNVQSENHTLTETTPQVSFANQDHVEHGLSSATGFVTPRIRRVSLIQDLFAAQTPRHDTFCPPAGSAPLAMDERSMEQNHPAKSDPLPLLQHEHARVLRSRSNEAVREQPQSKKRKLENKGAPTKFHSESSAERADKSKKVKHDKHAGVPVFDSFNGGSSVFNAAGKKIDLKFSMAGPNFEFDQDSNCHIAYKKNYLSLSASMRLPFENMFLEPLITHHAPRITAFIFNLSAVTCTNASLPAPLLQFDATRTRSKATEVKSERIDLDSVLDDDDSSETRLVGVKFGRIQFKHATGNNPRSAAGAVAHGLNNSDNSRITDATQASRVRLVVTVYAQVGGGSDFDDRDDEDLDAENMSNNDGLSIKLHQIGQWSSKPLIVRARSPATWKPAIKKTEIGAKTFKSSKRRSRLSSSEIEDWAPPKETSKSMDRAERARKRAWSTYEDGQAQAK